MKNLRNNPFKRSIVTLNSFQGLAKKGFRLKSAVLDYRVLGKLNVSTVLRTPSLVWLEFLSPTRRAVAQGLCFASAPSKSAKSQMLKQVQHDNKRSAFTLAEVLITLGIIGVIAAITIPAVIQNTQSQEAVVKLKKAYNTLKMVERQATVDRGPMTDWAWTGNSKTDFETYFKPYFDIMKDCGTGTGCIGKAYYYLNGVASYSDLDGDTARYKFITPDGLSVVYTAGSGTGAARRAWIFVDINGQKGPNKWGRDFFEFSIHPTVGIKPRGAYDAATAEPANSADFDASCNTVGQGWGCAAKVLSEGAINY